MEYLHSEEVAEGQGLVEYALILLLVALVVLAMLVLMGGGVNGIYSKITTSIITATT